LVETRNSFVVKIEKKSNRVWELGKRKGKIILGNMISRVDDYYIM
jgi:hypothetical protein